MRFYHTLLPVTGAPAPFWCSIAAANTRAILLLKLAAMGAVGAQPSGFVAFDNTVGGGQWKPEQQAATLKKPGCDGISYN